MTNRLDHHLVVGKTTVDRLSINLLIRMRDIKETDDDTGEGYGLLWDAVLDEIKAALGDEAGAVLIQSVLEEG